MHRAFLKGVQQTSFLRHPSQVVRMDLYLYLCLTCIYGCQRPSHSFRPINAGVFQASVLGATIFLQHINNLLSWTSNPIISFVEDSALSVHIEFHPSQSDINVIFRTVVRTISYSSKSTKPSSVDSSIRDRIILISLPLADHLSVAKQLAFIFLSRKYMSSTIYIGILYVCHKLALISDTLTLCILDYVNKKATKFLYQNLLS